MHKKVNTNKRPGLCTNHRELVTTLGPWIIVGLIMWIFIGVALL